MIKQMSLIACLTIVLAVVAHATVHAFIWDSTTGMTDLGSLGGDSVALGINDSGQVVGYSYLADRSTVHMITWTKAGGLVDLGSIDNGTVSVGGAINSAGDIAGEGYNANGVQVIFFWSSSTGYVSLGEIPGYGDGFGINDSDTITGVDYPPSQGIVWRPGFRRPLFLGTLPGGSQSEGQGINNLGHITGTATIATGAWDAFVWSKTGGMRDIGTVQQGVQTVGDAINDNDEVVGFGGIPLRAFYWRDSTGIVPMRGLGGTDAEAHAINNSGAIAGDCRTPSSVFHATLWSRHNAFPQDLGALPGGTIGVGNGINASGQVVGWSDVL